MNKTILKILYDVAIILTSTMIVVSLITKQIDTALLSLILLKMTVDDRKEC